MTLSARISAASVAMLDRILYALASPLAREIIDSLRDEPGAWGQCYLITHGKRTPEDELFCETLHCWLPFDCRHVSRDMGRGYVYFGRIDRLALRRAVNKWRQSDA